MTSIRSHKAFYLTFSFSVIALSISLIMINRYIDPRGIYRTGKFQVLVATARYEKSILIQSCNPKPQCIILGDSTCMRYSPHLIEKLTGLRTFNYAVNSGKMEDFLALLRYVLEELDIKPSLVILGVRPRSFYHRSIEDFDKRLLHNQVLMKYVPLNTFSAGAKAVKINFESLNWDYLKDVAKSVKKTRKHEPTSISGFKFQKNGFLHTDGTYDKASQFVNGDKTFKTEEALGFSKERLRYLDLFLTICKKNDIKLKIVITPNHPAFIKRVNQLDGSYTRMQKKLHTMLMNKNIDNYFDLYDFSQIENYGGIDEFMGGDHPSIYHSSLIIKKIFEETN
ncbi:MAG: hypothetical protein KKH94_08900 [Candidatus Omnitrophica bacterium]|nr:hypothetical protein [Candidatus Omnitrophota bacterium]